MPVESALVVVVHGFGGKRLWMQPLSFGLRRRFRVRNWSYFSLAGSVEKHGRRFHKFLAGLDHDGPIHIVAHSMGSIVVRAAISMGDVPNLKRIVLLAPPNCGSPVARSLSFVLGGVCRPFVELSSDKRSYVNALPPYLPFETAIIAARYDFLVPVKSTFIPNQVHHVTIAATHNSLLFSLRASRLVNNFLMNGRLTE